MVWVGSKGKWGGQGFGVKRTHIKKKDTSGGILGDTSGTITKRGHKFGFIQCDDYEEPVFCLGDELRQYQVGHIVKFTAYTDEQGKVSAKDLKPGAPGKKSAEPGKKKTWRSPQPMDTSGGIIGEMRGKIEKRGPKFGFIKCYDFDEPVFVLGSELKEYKAGQVVRFTAFMDEQGKPQACDLRSGLKGGGGGSGQSGRNVLHDLGAMLGAMGGDTWGGSGRWRPKPKDTSGGILGEKIGIIEKRGPKFGFITCDEYEEPVFVLPDELKQYKVGHTIKFTAFIDEQGKVQAMDLKSGLK